MKPNSSRSKISERSGIDHVAHLIVKNGPPVTAPTRRLAPDSLTFVKNESSTLFVNGIVHPSHSLWASLRHMVLKKDSISWRSCGDYRSLNEVTGSDDYPTYTTSQ